MNGIQPLDTLLKQAGISIDVEDETVETHASASLNKQQADDVIAIGAQAMKRYQNEFPEADAVDSETALKLLEQVQSASQKDLEQVHQTFDPERVFKLVGLLD